MRYFFPALRWATYCLRLALALALLLSFRPAHAQVSCTSKSFANWASGPIIVLPLAPSALASRRICGIHAVVMWGPTAGNFYFFASALPDCSVQTQQLSAIYYGVPNSVQEARDLPPLGAVLEIPNSYTVCFSLSATPTHANTEVSYAP